MYVKEWETIKEANSGVGGFKDGSYIEQYPRESDDKLKQRKAIAYYPNIIAPKVKRYNGFLFKRNALRTTKDDILKQIMKDIDREGNSIDVFMQNFSLETKLRGCNLVLVDNAKEFESTNLKEQKENREFPYLVQILPERVTKYKLDRFGNFDFIAFSDTKDESTYEKEDIKKITRYYDKNKCVVYDEKDKEIESIKHNLGVCPIVALSEEKKFPCVGEFTQLGGIMKRYYNLLSEEDELLRGQTFSILAIQAKEQKPEVNIGTDNALTYNSDKEPMFITPTSIPTTAYKEKIKKIEETVDNITYDINTNQGQESGITLSIKFEGLNSSLSAFATKLTNFETKVFNIIGKYLEKDSDVEVKYPNEFNVVDVLSELEKIKIMDEIADLPLYKKKKLEEILKTDLRDVTDDEIAEIVALLDDEKKDVGG